MQIETVQDLIEALQRQDPRAKVRVNGIVHTNAPFVSGMPIRINDPVVEVIRVNSDGYVGVTLRLPEIS